MRRFYIIGSIILAMLFVVGQRQPVTARFTNSSTGTVSNQSQAEEIPPGTDINHPIPLEMGVNEGILEPGEERWFSIEATNTDGGSDAYVPTTLPLYFTPNDVNPKDRVAMELFDSSMPAIWSKGYPNQIKSFGAGTPRELDNDDKSGEMIWSGSLFEGQTYYIRLRNDNAFPIDYLLFTFDIF